MDNLAKNHSNFTFLRFDEVESTNQIAEKYVDEKQFSSPAVIIAKKQLLGRGQGTNSWYSTENESLTFSLIDYPTFLLPENNFYLSKIAALAVIQTLNDYGIAAKIKWPNDIYIKNRKTTGILS